MSFVAPCLLITSCWRIGTTDTWRSIKSSLRDSHHRSLPYFYTLEYVILSLPFSPQALTDNIHNFQTLPTYFGNVCLRFIPVFDIVLHRYKAT